MVDSIETETESDISYSIFDSHCTNSHPTIAIDYQIIAMDILPDSDGNINIKKKAITYTYDDHTDIHSYKERVIMSFETLEELYLKMKEEIEKGNWCLCPRIQEIINNKTVTKTS